MISTDCQPGVAAGKLAHTVDHLRTLLDEYREELKKSEAAFDRWENEWSEREREIDSHLQTIQTRLGTTSGPALSLVRGDE